MKTNSNNLCLVAKEFGRRGSIIYSSSGESHKIKNMFDYLNSEILDIDTDIEVVMVKGIENYKEYYPLTYINDSKEFTKQVLEMMSKENNTYHKTKGFN